ncbi:MAG: TIGR00730 family Rossman fold protein [Deltaproteobacteria bacterium]|nr:TIGR00730 family Rossman fold protein [Deltaproteobacteria bacterium]
MPKIIKGAPKKRNAFSAQNFNVCIFCGSNPGKDPYYKAEAVKLAKGLAAMEAGLVYGGASVGIMGMLADTVLAEGGKVFGVIPEALKQKEVAHAGLTELRVVKTMHERKKLMFDFTDVFLTFPGGFGTLDETFEIITWKQIGIHQKPLIFLDIQGFYKPLIDFIDKAVADGFIKPEHRQLFQVAKGAEEALQLVDASRRAALP